RACSCGLAQRCASTRSRSADSAWRRFMPAAYSASSAGLMGTTVDVAASPPQAARRARPITRIDRGAVGGLFAGIGLLFVGWLAQGFLGRRTYLVEAGLLLLLPAVLYQRAVRGSLVFAEPGWLAPPLSEFRVAGKLHRGTMFVAGALALNLVSLVLFTIGWG